MIATLISSRNECPYCADSHGFFLRMHGGSAKTLCAVQQSNLNSPLLTASEQALFIFVQKVNENSQGIENTDIKTLNDAGWNVGQIAEAIHVAALFSTFNRVANAFGLKSQGLLTLCESQLAANK